MLQHKSNRTAPKHCTFSSFLLADGEFPIPKPFAAVLPESDSDGTILGSDSDAVTHLLPGMVTSWWSPLRFFHLPAKIYHMGSQTGGGGREREEIPGEGGGMR